MTLGKRALGAESPRITRPLVASQDARNGGGAGDLPGLGTLVSPLTSRAQRTPNCGPWRAKPGRTGGGPRVPASRRPSRSLPPRLLFSSPLLAARSPSPTGPGQAAPAPGAHSS